MLMENAEILFFNLPTLHFICDALALSASFIEVRCAFDVGTVKRPGSFNLWSLPFALF